MGRRRPSGRKKVNKQIIICCGAEKTEPNYFNSVKEEYNFPGKLVEVVVCKTRHGDPYSVVKEALKKKETKEDLVWAIIDKDQFTDFERAYSFAEKNGVRIALSSLCFEIWFLLHFQYSTRGHMCNDDMCRMLTVFLGREYSKSDTNMYECLKDKLIIAKKNAEKLRKYCREYSPDKKEYEYPSYTGIDNVLKSLDEYRRKFR